MLGSAAEPIGGPAEPNAGRVTLLRDTDGDGRADTGGVFVSGLDRPHGMAISGGYFYVTTPRDIFRIPYTPGDSQASGPAEIVGLPGALGNGRGHWTRNIAFAAVGRQARVAALLACFCPLTRGAPFLPEPRTWYPFPVDHRDLRGAYEGGQPLSPRSAALRPQALASLSRQIQA